MATIPLERTASIDDFGRKLDEMMAYLQTPEMRAALLQALNATTEEIDRPADSATQSEFKK